MSPATNAIPIRTTTVPPTRPSSASTSPPTIREPLSRTTPTPQETVNDRLQRIAMNERSTGNEFNRANIQYCHYFTNYGKCHFEEKSGQRCRFSHEVAPMCQASTSCSRVKCMYTHPNVGGRRNTTFLGKSENNMTPWPQMMNPMMNPWNLMSMAPFQHQPMSPFQGRRQNSN